MNNGKPYDCIVIGGGPAGCTCATILADYGRRVLLLEKSKFPRHHIGESLMPQTYWTFKRIGILDKLKKSDFVRKESVQFVSASGKESAPYYFPDRDPGEWSTTWQVNRARFDKMLLDNAHEHGVDVRENVRVSEVLFEGERATGVQAIIDGQRVDLGAKVVVDASGVNALLAKQLDLRFSDEKLHNAVIYAYYKNALRDEGRNHGATLVIHTPDKQGWFWFIPLENQITSIGVVGPPSFLVTGRGDDPMATLDEEIARCPAIARRVEEAERVSHAYVTSDFTYRSRKIAGNGWVLIGDAFCFLDPIYSNGVLFAFKGGEFAADTIHEALNSGDLSGERLGSFGPKLVEGIHLMRQLVYTYYDPSFSFSQFNRRFPEQKDNLVRLLIGDVFNDEVGDIFNVLRDWVKLPTPAFYEGQPA